jgi:hypothetical protein
MTNRRRKVLRRGSSTFDDVRAIALALPDVEETTAYGMPAFKVGKVRFAGEPIPRSDVEPTSLGVHMSFAERDRRIATRPRVYYLTEHYARYPAVLVRLANVRRDELEEILGAAWRRAMERAAAPRAQRRKPSLRTGRTRR